ncbi:MAG: hypothetical protein IJ272_02810 [Clostridia bacterium]|nr:hypothetical protein [Clostridia bacterium]
MIKKKRISMLAAIAIYIGLMVLILIIKSAHQSGIPNKDYEGISYEKEFDEYKKDFLDNYDIDLKMYDGSKLPYIEDIQFKQIDMDKDVISYVERLDSALKKYPEKFLKELKYSLGKDMYKTKIELYLGTDIVTNSKIEGSEVAGATSHSAPNSEIILLDIHYINKVDHYLAHELFHILENKGIAEARIYFVPEFTTARWDSNNPQGFKYLENAYQKDTSFLMGEKEDIYFTTKYSKRSRIEDMAEVFGMMMSYEEDNVPDSFYSPHVINKMKFISEFLEENYESATDEAHWNRWLNSVDK